MDGQHGELIHKAERCQVKHSDFAQFTRQGKTLYVHAYFWPGETLAIGGLNRKCFRPSCTRAASR